MKGPDLETSWNNMSRDVPNVKNLKQIFHEEKHPYNVLMCQQEKAHSNTYRWTLSQIYPGLRVLIAYLRSLTKGVPKQPNLSPVTKQSMVQVSPKNTSDI